MRASSVVVAALYQFKQLDVAQVRAYQKAIQLLCTTQHMTGTILLAEEGINGTVAGCRNAIDALKHLLEAELDFDQLMYKESFCQDMPFLRMKVKIKSEIVTLGCEKANPNQQVGTYVKPKDWHKIVTDPEVLLIDTRNDYEIAIGQFQGAIDPKTKNFREFPRYVANNLDPKKHKKVAMYCTGGIRCEKASSHMLAHGFEEIYHLEGGILQYLEDVPEEDSLWQGSCFVFDERVAVDHQLKQDNYRQCYGCRHPLTPDEVKHPKTILGICCPHCCDHLSESQKKRFSERQKQMTLAKKKGQQHLGQIIQHHDQQSSSDTST